MSVPGQRQVEHFMEDDEAEVSPFDKLPTDVNIALSAVLQQGDIPPCSLALYARWWQLENWLRELAYVELRSRDGLAWNDNLGDQAKNRQQNDKRFEYMASPDWDDPLAYLDASKLFNLIDEHWRLFEPSLLSEAAWRGRRDELLGIRNRIGHLRHPHRDDLRRLEQMLRDLETGTSRAITSYNRLFDVEHFASNDMVTAAYRSDGFTDAKGLMEHAYRKYHITLRLSYTVHPWATHPEQGATVSGTSGLLWKITCYGGPYRFDVNRIWRELTPSTREILLHLLISCGGPVEMTLAAVDNPELAIIAIGDMLHAVLRFTHPYNKDKLNSSGITSRTLRLDSRIQMDTPWAFIDDDMPTTFFNAS